MISMRAAKRSRTQMKRVRSIEKRDHQDSRANSACKLLCMADGKPSAIAFNFVAERPSAVFFRGGSTGLESPLRIVHYSSNPALEISLLSQSRLP
jgi:hypothetical protein